MIKDLEQEEEFPYVIFKIHETKYCVSSAYVCSIQIPTKVHFLPEEKTHLTGFFLKDKETIPIISMRPLLKFPSLEEELKQFSLMKAKHINWVETLQKSVLNNTEFHLPTNPRACAFGLWYYSYQTESPHLKFILKQIEAPHTLLHQTAIEIKEFRRLNEFDKIEKKLLEANRLCYEEILPRLDLLIEAWQEAHRGIWIILENDTIKAGLLVDEAIRLLPLKEAGFAMRNPIISIESDYTYLIDEVFAHKNGETLLNLNISNLFKTVLSANK